MGDSLIQRLMSVTFGLCNNCTCDNTPIKQNKKLAINTQNNGFANKYVFYKFTYQAMQVLLAFFYTLQFCRHLEQASCSP